MSTSINYLDEAWNVARGCSPNMSCAPRCWAREDAHIHAGHPNPKVRAHYEGLTDSKGNWTGVARLDESVLLQPLRWRKPRVVGVAFSGDLFRLPAYQIDRVFAVMALCPQHTFLMLTKLPERIVEYFARLHKMADDWAPHAKDGKFTPSDVLNLRWMHGTFGRGPAFPYGPWPLPNLYLGFSSSNQSEFDARAPHVLKLAEQGWKTWVSLEPLVGPVDVSKAVNPPHDEVQVGEEEWLHRDDCPCNGTGHMPRLSQVVLGGESGKDARPCDVAWLRSVVRQCQDAGVPCFVKQLGAYSFNGSAPLPMTAPCGLKEIENRIALKHPKGADPSEWPDDLRVQELAWEVGR